MRIAQPYHPERMMACRRENKMPLPGFAQWERLQSDAKRLAPAEAVRATRLRTATERLMDKEELPQLKGRGPMRELAATLQTLLTWRKCSPCVLCRIKTGEYLYPAQTAYLIRFQTVTECPVALRNFPHADDPREMREFPELVPILAQPPLAAMRWRLVAQKKIHSPSVSATRHLASDRTPHASFLPQIDRDYLYS